MEEKTEHMPNSKLYAWHDAELSIKSRSLEDIGIVMCNVGLKLAQAVHLSNVTDDAEEE